MHSRQHFGRDLGPISGIGGFAEERAGARRLCPHEYQPRNRQRIYDVGNAGWFFLALADGQWLRHRRLRIERVCNVRKRHGRRIYHGGTGLATLTGMLDVELANGFTPSDGESFDIISGLTTGNFTQLNLPSLSAAFDGTQATSTRLGRSVSYRSLRLSRCSWWERSVWLAGGGDRSEHKCNDGIPKGCQLAVSRGFSRATHHLQLCVFRTSLVQNRRDKEETCLFKDHSR